MRRYLWFAVTLLVSAPIYAGDDPWRTAIDRSDIQTLRALAKTAPSVDLPARRGKTALMVAVVKNDLQLIKLLIELGADVNKFNQGGGTALMYAAQYGHLEAARVLLKGGAKVNAQGGKFWSALMIAVLKGRLPMIELLLQNGADVNASDMLGASPLARAVEREYVDVARRLLEVPSLDINARDRSGMTALHMAAAVGNDTLATALLAHGARIDIKEENGFTPADLAQRNGHTVLAAKLR